MAERGLAPGGAVVSRANIVARAIARTIRGVVASAAFAFSARAQTATSRAVSLGEAVRLAASQSAAVQSASAQADVLEARMHGSRSALLPSIGAAWTDGKRSYNSASFGIPFPGFDPNGSIISGVRTIDARAHASMTVWNPVALSDYRNADAAARRGGADVVAVREAAMVAAAMAYVRAARGDAQVTARAADSSLAAELLGIAQQELRSGVGVVLDVTRAQVQVARVRAQLVAAREERDRARLELLRVTGLPLNTVVELRDSLAALPRAEAATTPEAAVAAALQERDDLRALGDAIAASARAVSAARDEWRPSVALFGDDGYTAAKYPYLQRTYTYGVQVSVPIWEGSRRESRVEERDAVLRGADLRKRDLETQIAVDVRAALLDLSAAREQVAAASDAVSFAEQAVAQARDRFRTGVAGSGDVVSAQLDASASRSQLVDALTALQSARVALARAQGRLSAMP